MRKEALLASRKDNCQLLEAYGFFGEDNIVLPEVDKGFAQELVELSETI